MPNSDAQRLTELIYASLLGERTWQEFLDALAEILPNGKALLLFHDAAARHGAFALTSGFETDAIESYKDYYAALNPWMDGASTRQIGKVTAADAMLPRHDLEKTEFYSDFLRPREIHSGLGITIFRDQQYNFMLSLLSAGGDEERYQRAARCLDALVPHLQRVFSWHHRGSRSGERFLDDIREDARAGLLSVGVGRRVRAQNPSAEKLLKKCRQVSVDQMGRLQCVNEDVCNSIDEMLSSWMKPDGRLSPATFLLPAGGGSMRLTVLSPRSGNVDEFFRGPECTLILEDLSLDLKLAAREFSALYELTPAETKVVVGLGEGYSLNGIAAVSGTSIETVRRQMKTVFAKTGFSRQVDIVRNLCVLASALVHI